MKKIGILAVLGALALASGCNMNDSKKDESQQKMNGQQQMQDRDSSSYWNQQGQQRMQQDGQPPAPQAQGGCNSSCPHCYN